MENYTQITREVGVMYNGEKFNSFGAVAILLGRNCTYYNVSKVPAKIGQIFQHTVSDDKIVLKKGHILFDFIDKNPVFKEVWDEEIVVYKEKDSDYDFETIKAFINPLVVIDNKCLEEISNFIVKVIALKNKYVYENFLNRSFLGKISKTKMSNLLAIAVCSLEGVEKIIKSDHSKILKKNLENTDFYIGNNGELTKVLDMPKFVLDYIKENKAENCYLILQEFFKTFGADNIKTLVDFLEVYEFYIKRFGYYCGLNLPSSIETIMKIMKSDEGYRLKPLINYLIRQNIYFGKTGYPYDEIINMYDYIDMCKKWGFEYERFPSMLEKTHDTVCENIKLLMKENSKEAFEKVSNSLKCFEMKQEPFTLIVPKQTNDLIKEGNALNHCVGSYVDRMIDGSSKIFFIRKIEEPNKPFVTIELDKNNHMVQMRGKNNSEPSKEVKEFVKMWIQKVRRL